MDMDPVGSNINNVFEQARDSFLSSLSLQDRRLYSPCASADDFLKSLRKLEVLARRAGSSGRWLQSINTIADCLKPYFQVVDILVSSHPEYAALAWGALRLVFQLAGNFSTFFDKLIRLLSSLADMFPQFDLVLELCRVGDIADKAPPNIQDDNLRKLRAPGSRIRRNVEAVYLDLFQIIQASIRVFTKSDGRLKKTPTVIGELLWKPFDMRFDHIVKQMLIHRKTLLEEILLWTSNNVFKERVQAAAERRASSRDRDLQGIERQESTRERALAREERRLMVDELRRDREEREHIVSLLVDIREKLQQERVDTTYFAILSWLEAPDYAAVLKRVSMLRQEGTAVWIFEEPFYRCWLEQKPTPPAGPTFGSGAMWICGHPGFGKTTLASSVIDRLNGGEAVPGEAALDVHYFFFDYSSPDNATAAAAYRALLHQVLQKRHGDRSLLDSFVFATKTCTNNDESSLLELLELSLRDDCVLVLDGIDECQNPHSLVESLLDLSKRIPRLRLLFFSRVTAQTLKRSVQKNMQHELAKDSLDKDIRCFYYHEFEKLFNDGILLESSRQDLEAMVGRLLRGADGMFLWARLMIEYLRSDYLTPMHRLEAIADVSSPEDLGKMYGRIVLLISSSGQKSSAIASRVLAWLIYAMVPMTSQQVRQALIADDCLPKRVSSEDVREFENAAIMACSGLVERHVLKDALFYPSGTAALRLVHLSAREILMQFSSSPLLSPLSTDHGTVLLDAARANLRFANSCLRQLLYHTPAQPIPERIGARVPSGSSSEEIDFTSYSAVLWIDYLHKTTKSTLAVPSEELLAVEESFSAFLQRSAVVSAWLERFYGARMYKLALGHKHPPSDFLRSWAVSLERWKFRSRLDSGSLYNDIQDFSAEMTKIVEAWGDILVENPEIIWDEMTCYVDSRFFFNSRSTRASFQDPEPPLLTGLLPNPVALMSKTANAGDIKGVLSIWAPRVVNDVRGLHFMWNSTQLNLHQVCDGWVAGYEVWSLRESPTRIVKIQELIDPQDLLSPVRRYLSQTFSNMIDLPMAISSDALAFTVLRKLCVVKPDSRGGAQIFADTLPASQLGTAFPQAANVAGLPQPYSYAVHFGTVGGYLSRVERDETGRHVFTMFRRSTTDKLAVETVGSLDLSNLESTSTITFHPALAIVAFQATWWSTTASARSRQAIVVFWLFRSEFDNIVVCHIENLEKAIHFSTCGSYLVLQRPRDPAVLPVPPTLLNNPAAQIPSEGSNRPAELGSALSGLATLPNTQPISMLKETTKALTQASTVGPSGNINSLSVSVSRGEIKLCSAAGSESHTTKLTVVPTGYNLENTKQTVIPPQTRGDTLRISIDKEAQSRYSIVRSLAGAEKTSVSVIERDPRFIAPLPPIHSNTEAASNEWVLAGAMAGAKKRRIDSVDLEADQDGEARRGDIRECHLPLAKRR